ncbi:MAG: YwqG family protein, partial [Myxococcales bacterium]|nr:YwqG family protein [Myxococcales bacterium]
MAPSELPPELEPIRGWVEQSTVPCVVLCPSFEVGPRTCLGGLPWMPPGMPWPRYGGEPLSFLGQLDFGELAATGLGLAGLPAEGILCLFYDMSRHPRGDRPDDDEGWALVFSPDPAQTVEASCPPGFQLLEPEPLTAHAAISLPRPGDLFLREWSEAPEREPWFDAYGSYSERLTLAQGPMPPLLGFQQQVGGFADWLGGDGRLIAQLASAGFDPHTETGRLDAADPTLLREAQEWRLLWQLSPQQDMLTWIDT